MSQRRPKKTLAWKPARELFETHLRAKRSSPLTVKAYLRAVQLLEERWRRPAAVTLAGLRELLVGLLTGKESRSGKPLSSCSVGKSVAGWRSFFRLLAEEGHVELDPTSRLESPKNPKRPPGQALTVKEVQRLLNAADVPGKATALRDRAVTEVLYATGVRRAELCALDLTDLDHDERELTVREGKGGKGRIVPLTRSAYHQLQRYLEGGRPGLADPPVDKRGRRQTEGRPKDQHALFLTRFGSRIDPQTVRRILIALRKRAGIRKEVTPHTMRRTFATHLLKQGASVRHIQVLLGHSCLSTTAQYLRLDAKDLRREILLRHPRERFQ